VNFSLPLRAFEPSFRGLRNLLQLLNSSPRPGSFIFCSSTAAVLGPKHTAVVQEIVSTSPDDSDAMGYSKSKWVAEAICSRAAQSFGKVSEVKIVRIGQLTGDTKQGVWNINEAYPLMLSTVNDLGCLPSIEEKLSWLPLDIAAKAVCEISLSLEERYSKRESKDLCEVYHVVNNNTSTSFPDLLRWLKNVHEKPFDLVDPREWLDKLEKQENHPAKALIGLWRRAYQAGSDEASKQATNFDTKNAKEVSQTMRDVHRVDKKLFEKIWKWLEGEIA
jgi:thioester reductase-like protein